MSICVDLQIASRAKNLPSHTMITKWLDTITGLDGDAEVTVRIVDEKESAELNEAYRKKTGPTNVLSFVNEPLPHVPSQVLGDIVICAPVVEREAQEQGKQSLQHWAHMIVHGVLHLLGYDHQSDSEADEMEAMEIRILSTLGFANPYIAC